MPAQFPPGRPKGSTNFPKLADSLTEEEKRKIVKTAYNKAIKGDSKLLTLFVEQIYGKARQVVGLEGSEEGSELVIKLIKYDGTTASTSLPAETVPVTVA